MESKEDLLKSLRSALRRLHDGNICHQPSCIFCQECPGYERGGKAAPCCERAGEYNGYPYEDGPALFCCPRNCGCHD